ncbi:MAG: ATP-binding protein [Hyphomicrobiaceae bacterium]|nr:MAG: ATP-binding protein [Hyphomicrobiaceae bacterium]
MAKDLSQDTSKDEVARADIVFYGDKITLPENMKPGVAVRILQEFEKSQEQVVAFHQSYPVFPWDGAMALSAVLKKKFGWVKLEGLPSFFGRQPPQLINIEVAPNQFEPCIWGEFTIPTAEDAILSCGTTMSDNRLCFQISAKMKRKNEAYVRSILAEVGEYLKHNSIYRGKAIRLKIFDEDGDMLSMPTVSHVDTSSIKRESLILPKAVHTAVETNLFTPIERINELAANNLPIKRGVLLGGTFGTGKTMTAGVAAKLAVENKITFIYVTRANELPAALRFAEMYQSPGAVVFCEDIDREMSGSERSAEMDDILNIIDGVDTKRSNIMTVLTTNAMQEINKAMLRPGRLDAVIEVTPPDAEAVERLIRHYGGGLISASTDLTNIGAALSGCIPAVIAEVVKRAKLSQLRLQPKGTPLTTLSVEALLESAETMTSQLKLMAEPIPETEPTIDSAIARMIREGTAHVNQSEIHEATTRAVANMAPHIARHVAANLKTVK